MRLRYLISTVLFLLFNGLLFAQDVEHEHGSYKLKENKGQWPEFVNFKADADGGKIWFEDEGILYQFLDYSEMIHGNFDKKAQASNGMYKECLVYAKFVDANPNVQTVKHYPTTEYYNYFLGNDESKWASDVHGYGRVDYINLYPNIDLSFFEKEGDLKYEYHVKPGGDFTDIKVKYYGAEKIKKQKDGNVIIYSPLGQIIEQKPYVYQIVNGKIIEIQSEFSVSSDKELSFVLGDFNPDVEIVIDPILVFATYNGANSDNFGMTATYAHDGSAYTGGTLYGNSYPTPAPAWNTIPNITVANTNVATTDVFISKYSPDGTAMIWTNFIGGGDNTQGTETVHSLICDYQDNVYLYGVTSSTDFPIMNGVQTMHAGGSALNIAFNGSNFGTVGTDIFVSKLSANGMNLLGSTYMGGSSNDGVNYKVTSGSYNSIAAYDSLTTNYGDQFRGEIMLDSLNNVLIASCSRSTDFPTSNSFQLTNNGQQDGVVFKLSADFSSILWSTYYGGAENDACYSVKIDSSYNILIAGGTSSTNLPNTAGGLNPAYQGGKTDGFVAKISPDGALLTQSTYIGTNTYDQVIFVEIDRWDNVYIVGQSNGNMPIINAAYSNANSGQFIQKLAPDLTSIIYATRFGNGNGVPNISPSAFLVDVCGNVYVSGWGANILQGTGLTGMPTTPDAFQLSSGDGFNFYLFVLERDATSLLYGSYIGDLNAQEHVDGGTSRFDKFGVVYQSVCGGCGASSSFPTTPGAFSAVNNSTNCNNLVFKFDFELVPVADFNLSSFDGCAPFLLTLDNESTDTINSVWTFPAGAIIVSGGVNPQLLFNDPGTYEIIISITDTICNLQDTAVKIITVYDALELYVPNDTIVCSSYTTDLTANSNGSAISFTWSDDINFSNVLNSGAMDSTINVTPTETTTYYVTATNGWPDCDLIDSVVIQFVDGAIDVDPAQDVCYGDTLVLEAHNLLPSVSIDFSWTPANQVLIDQDSIAFVAPTTSQYFYVTGVTSLGCTIVDSVWVNVNYVDPATVYAIATPDTIPIGASSVLTAFPNSAGYTYNWFPPNGLSLSTGQSVTATPSATSTYNVEIAGNGCVFNRTVEVVVYEFECGGVYIFVPSGFTPNGDGENDLVYVRGLNLEKIEFKIFDRWGEKMFESTDQSVGWDGTYKGKAVDPDVYVYHLVAVCFDGQETLIKGNISLLR